VARIERRSLPSKKAWGFACNADWISKQLEVLLAEYQKLQEQDKSADADIKELAGAIIATRSRTETSARRCKTRQCLNSTRM
jgi:hypothetical protein